MKLGIVFVLSLGATSMLPYIGNAMKKQQVLAPTSLNSFQSSPEIPKSVPVSVFLQLYRYAHLIDISYCVSNTNHISEPFECDLSCSHAFPDVSLLYQWFFDDTVAGYIATSNSDPLQNNSTSHNNIPTIIVSLRGTQSAPDTYTDLKVDMTSYENLHNHLSQCGPRCKVHKGFHDAYLATLGKIEPLLDLELAKIHDKKAQLLFMGHSLGGAVAMLLSLHYLDKGYDNKLVTMGQPLVGNDQFTAWTDLVLGSSNPIEKRKFWRIIHKGDIIATIPNKHLSIGTTFGFPPYFKPFPPPDIQPDSYTQFENQIYINCSTHNAVPKLEEVVDCLTSDNMKCIKGDFAPLVHEQNIRYDAHLYYFRKMGFCGVRI
ncbi:hypothetical protein CAAN1_04S04632 [[Candida] anglica]|uniref:triacylglycerol lipase n=1 Tax=[Candida] anglica TaxID=148631 RepID=A0ABP0E8Y1_9ASCO